MALGKESLSRAASAVKKTSEVKAKVEVQTVESVIESAPVKKAATPRKKAPVQRGVVSGERMICNLPIYLL